MAAVFTELERRMITKRLHDGRIAKKARGGHSVGPAPYGYTTKDGVLRYPPGRPLSPAHAATPVRGKTTRDIAAALHEGRPPDPARRYVVVGDCLAHPRPPHQAGVMTVDRRYLTRYLSS